MTKKPREKRREGKPEETGGLWITVMGQLLLGGAAAVLAAVLALLVCSLLISAGAVPERFMERMELDAVQIYGDGAFEFWFNDGDLFWGHAIHVTGSLDQGPEMAQMEG